MALVTFREGEHAHSDLLQKCTKRRRRDKSIKQLPNDNIQHSYLPPLSSTSMLSLNANANANARAMSVAESLAVMIRKERSVYSSCDYLHGHDQQGLQGEMINEEDRTKMVEWCYKVVDVCQLNREIVAMAMEMVDRFLSNKSSATVNRVMSDRIQFQLLTLTALYVSIKMSSKTALGSDFFSLISCDLYSKKDIEAMELILLKELSWNISAPTCIQIAHHILSLLSTKVHFEKTVWSIILDEVNYQTECTVRDYFFATQRPSTVAMAVVCNTLDRVLNKHHGDQDIIIQAALMSVMKDTEFESLEVILATRTKLNSLVYGNDEDEITDQEQEDDDNEEITDYGQWYSY